MLWILDGILYVCSGDVCFYYAFSTTTFFFIFVLLFSPAYVFMILLFREKHSNLLFLVVSLVLWNQHKTNAVKFVLWIQRFSWENKITSSLVYFFFMFGGWCFMIYVLMYIKSTRRSIFFIIWPPTVVIIIAKACQTKCIFSWMNINTFSWHFSLNFWTCLLRSLSF